MTQPAAQGYPDWRRVSSRADALFQKLTMIAGTSDGEQTPVFVGNQPSLGIFANRVSGNWNLKFEFYNDPDQTVFLGRHEFDFFGGTFFLRESITVLGPWLFVTGQGAAAGSQLNCTVAATSQPGTYADRGWTNILLTTTANAIAAGATETLEPSYLWPGNAFLCYQMATQASILQLDAQDSGGVSRTFWRRSLAAGAKVGEMIALPSQSIIARITNSGGAADAYDLYLTGQHHIMRS